MSKKDRDQNATQDEDILETTEENVEQTTGQPASETLQQDHESQAVLQQMIRLQADFDNYKKRTTKEKEEIFKYAIEDFSKKLLPVLDNLERAIQALDKNNIQDDYANGVRMVLTQLMQVLEQEGLKEISCEGEMFDPNLHHGVTVEDSEAHDDDQIMDVYQKGYQFKGKVIRPAMVKICKKN